MYVFQLFYQATYAGRTKRVMKFFQFENLLDALTFFVGTSYIIIVLRDYRYGTFLADLTAEEEAFIYFDQWLSSPVMENALLWTYGLLLWIKAGYQAKYLSITGDLFQILSLLIFELLTFGIMYLSVMLLYAIVGIVVFNDLASFMDLRSAMFTLFRASIGDYNVDIMDGSRIGSLLAYAYFITYLVLNVALLVNLIVAQLAYAYKKYKAKRSVFWLLSTLSVREISEADDKYSAVISVPFPFSLLNLVFGSIVLGSKSPCFNNFVLHMYFAPIMVVELFIFCIWQVFCLPLTYVKIIGHKWALAIKAPKGKNSFTTADRVGQACLFMLLGVPLLTLVMIADIYWFLVFTYKTDLDKSFDQRNKMGYFIGDVGKTAEIHRRTYKKMTQYFESQNDQLVLQ